MGGWEYMAHTNINQEPVFSGLTDEQLMQHVIDRSERALEELMRRHSSRLGSIVYQILGRQTNRLDVEELVSNTFLAVWKAAKSYNLEKGTVITWLSAIIAHDTLKYGRKLSQLAALQAELHYQRAYAEPALVDSRWTTDRVQFALTTLQSRSPREADIVIRRYLHDQSVSEIAATLSISPNLVSVRLSRGLKKMRALLQSA
jgi:RNA polymerase sigma-70 factor (ECF subfamily)